MARKGQLSDLGVLLAVIGAILMVVFGIVYLIQQFVGGFESVLNSNYNISLIGSSSGWLVAGVVAIVLGAIILYIWKNNMIRGNYLVYGIVFVVIGIIGGSLGGLLVLIGGILLILDEFL